MSRYCLYKSRIHDFWEVKDKETGVIISFYEGCFNEKQEAYIPESMEKDPVIISRVLRQMGEWVNRYHASVCFSSVHCIERSEDDKHLFLLRNKSPKMRIEILQTMKGRDFRALLREYASSLQELTEDFTEGYELVTPAFRIEILEDVTSRHLQANIKKAAASLLPNYIYEIGR